jgi:hypothetical protein
MTKLLPKFGVEQVVCSKKYDTPVKIRSIKTMSGGQHGNYFVYVTDGYGYSEDELRPLTAKEKRDAVVVRSKKEKRTLKTCPMCGVPWEDDGSATFIAHVRHAHETDSVALAHHLQEALERAMNRRKS